MLFRFTLSAVLSTAAATAKLDDANTKKNPFVPQKLREKYLASPLNRDFENSLGTPTGVDVYLPVENRNAVSIETLLKNPSSSRETKEGPITTSEIVEDTANIDSTFDESEELGILNAARSMTHVEKQQQRELANGIDCHGKHPLVNPDMNFRAIVRRCVIPAYMDNCPFNASLPLDCWDTSQVTDMSYGFYQLADFNQPLDSWDVSSVTDMSDLFGFASSFNNPLSSWDLKSVTDMSDMFWGAKAFNQPLNSWDVSSVQLLDYTFLDATSFNQPLDSWDTTSAVNMKYTFAYATNFDQPLNSWSTDKVTDMGGMFWGATTFNQPLSSWDVERVTSMKNMFMAAENFNQNIDSFNTISVQDMTYMFNKATKFNQCLSTWAYKNPTTITGPLIFNGTSCPVQGIPDVISGPWCQDAYDQCYPSSSANSNYPFSSGGQSLASAILLGAFLTSDVIFSFLF